MPYDDEMGGTFNSGLGSAAPSKTNGSGTSTGWGGSSTPTKSPSSGSSYSTGLRGPTGYDGTRSVTNGPTGQSSPSNEARGSNSTGYGSSASTSGSKSAGSGGGSSGGGGWGRDSGPSDNLSAPSSGNNTNPNISNAIAKAINTYSTVNAVKNAVNSIGSYFGGQGTTSYGKPPNGNTGMYPGRGDYEFMGPVPNAANDRVAAGLARNDGNATTNGGGGWGATGPYSSLNGPSTGNNTNPNVSNAIRTSIRAAQQSAALQEAARQISRMFGGNGEYGVPASYDLERSATSPAQSLANAFAPNYQREIGNAIAGTQPPSARTSQLDGNIQAITGDPTNMVPSSYPAMANLRAGIPAPTKQITDRVPTKSDISPFDVAGIRGLIVGAAGGSLAGTGPMTDTLADGEAAPVTTNVGTPSEPGLPSQRGGVAPPDAGNVTRPGTVSPLETVNAKDWTTRMGGRDTSGQQQAQQQPGTPSASPPIPDPVAIAVTAGVMPWDISSFLALQRTMQKQGTPYTAADFVRDFYGGSRPLAQASYNPIPPIKTAA